MKRKYDGGEAEAGGAARAPLKKKQRNRSRLGGGGLSLEAFADAKSKPRINPAQIREHREFYQNAKKIRKYKKFVKQQGGHGSGGLPQVENHADKPVRDDEGANEGSGLNNRAPANFGRNKLQVVKTDGKDFKTQRKVQQGQKQKSRLERMKEEYDKEKLEKEEKRREREELYREQEEGREKARQGRKEVQVRLRKKTQRGQPVMKHRMELLLETIQRG